MADEGKNALLGQVDRIKNNIRLAYDAAKEGGALLPEVQNSDNLPATIAAIPKNGIVDEEPIIITKNGTTNTPDGKRYNPIIVNVTGSVGEEAVPNLIRLIDIAASLTDSESIINEDDYTNENIENMLSKLFVLSGGV